MKPREISRYENKKEIKLQLRLCRFKNVSNQLYFLGYEDQGAPMTVSGRICAHMVKEVTNFIYKLYICWQLPYPLLANTLLLAFPSWNNSVIRPLGGPICDGMWWQGPNLENQIPNGMRQECTRGRKLAQSNFQNPGGVRRATVQRCREAQGIATRVG